MRVAIVIWQLDMYGGSIRQALELARFLGKQKHEVDVYAFRVDKERCFPEIIKHLNVVTPKQTGLKQLFYDPGDTLIKRVVFFLYNIFVQTQQVKALRSVLMENHRQNRYDVMNLHDNGLLSIPVHIKDARVVWMMNDPPSFIDTHEKKASLYSNSMIVKILAYLQSIFASRAIHNIDVITVLDKRNAKIVQKYFHKKAIIVRSGLDIASNISTMVKPKSKNIKILTTNIFFRHRRYEDLVEAARILIHKHKKNNVEFRIVGASDSDEDYYNKIRSLVAEYKLDDYFVFLGRVNERQLKSEYTIADVFVFPNHNQTWGLSVFEAMMHSCAVVVSATCGACDVLTNKVNARIVSPKSPQKLALILKDLIENPRQRKILAKRGQKFVLENISWDKYAQQMVRIFTQ